MSCASLGCNCAADAAGIVHHRMGVPLTHPDESVNLQQMTQELTMNEYKHNHLPSTMCAANPSYVCEQPKFETKDSGDKKQFPSGMTRNSSAGKLGWHRVTEGPMLKRWAGLLTRGAVIYPDVKPGQANWTLANSDVELQEAKEKAYRHFMEWYNGENLTEDTAAAVFFNINLAEHVKEKLKDKPMDIRQG